MNLPSKSNILKSQSLSRFQNIKSVIALDSTIRTVQNRIKLFKAKEQKKTCKAKAQQKILNEIEQLKTKAKQEKRKNQEEMKKREVNLTQLHIKNRLSEIQQRSKLKQITKEILNQRQSEHKIAKEISEAINHRIWNQKQSFLSCNRDRRNSVVSASLKGRERVRLHQEDKIRKIKECVSKQSQVLDTKRMSRLNDLQQLETIESQLIHKLPRNQTLSSSSSIRSRLSAHSSYRKSKYTPSTLAQIYNLHTSDI